ncbi:MAG TPA: MerR family transcriptional regulator [Chloroflexia bacterium]|nr:MerR family transcriptional regulator [Chloroflexia bacterium]
MMKPLDTFYVKEFAQLAGVTVRTLQYYDKEGLLKPSYYTSSNHRLYRREDLLRLQQILTLKYMGFTLEEIRQLLASPEYNVRTSLQIQKEAIDERITQLQKVSNALDETLKALAEFKPVELDWSTVCHMIQGVSEAEKWHWIYRYHNYFTEEQQQLMVERRKLFTPREIVQGERDWAEIISACREMLRQGVAPDSPAAQELAARMGQLIYSFTGGDKGLGMSLKHTYDNFEKIPEDKRPYELEVQRFISQVLEVYFKSKASPLLVRS